MLVGAVMEQGGDTSVKTSMLWLVGAFLPYIRRACLSQLIVFGH